MATHQPTKAYVQRRTQEGMPTIEIVRCLKRYVARQLFPVIRAVAEEQDLIPTRDRSCRHAA